MKNLHLIIYLVLIMVLTGCFDEKELNGPVVPFSLIVHVGDAKGKPVRNAEVTLFQSQDDYLKSKNGFASKSTNDNGEAIFNSQELGKDPGVFFEVKVGNQRNWASTSNVPLLKTSGKTRVKTVVADLGPSFIKLSSKSWKVQSYTNANKPYPFLAIKEGIADECNFDDTFDFLKTGILMRYDDGKVCNPMREASPKGTDWSSWSLTSDGKKLIMRVFDPIFFQLYLHFNTGSKKPFAGNKFNYIKNRKSEVYTNFSGTPVPISVAEDKVVITYPGFPPNKKPDQVLTLVPK